MDVTTEAITARYQANLQNQVAMKVLRKSLDLQAEQGASLVKLIDQAGGLGRRLDQLG